MATQAALVKQAGERLNDESHSSVPAPLLRTWINEGCAEVATRAECFLTSGTVSVVAATASYTAPVDIVRINAVQFEAQSQIYTLDYIERMLASQRWGVNQTQQSAWPEYYTSTGIPGSLSITLFPVPSQAGTLRIFYFRLATTLAIDGSAAASTVDIPAGWERVILDYVEARAYRRDRRPDDYTMAMQSFTEKLIALKETGDNNYNTAAREWSEDDMYAPEWMY